MRYPILLALTGALAADFCLPTHADTLTLADLGPGDLVVTEFLANPVGVADSEGEYFEILNRRGADVDLAGLVIRDDGSNRFTVSGLTLGAGAFGVFGNGDGAALGIIVDYVYGAGMSLTNAADEIVLVGAGDTELFRLAYTDGDAFGAGVAGELRVATPGLSGAGDSDYTAATLALQLDNFGSPGSAGGTRVSAVPVPAAAWLLGSALAGLAPAARRRARRRSV